MKGVIALCLKELVVSKFGQEKWQEALKKAGIDKEPMILPVSDVDDKVFMKILNAVCDVLGISLAQAADAFGDYMVNVFSQKMYRAYYTACKSAKDFLLKMDQVHVEATKKMAGARPPRFEYEWKDDKTLIMKYKSHRNLIDIMVGLIKGVGKYYKTDLKVSKLGPDKVQIVFP